MNIKTFKLWIYLLVFTSLTFAQTKPEFDFLKKLDDYGEWSFGKVEVQLDIVQPVDHKNPDGKKFTQRVFIKHVGFDKPVVLHTRGYYARPGSKTELATILDCNEIEVEHRFFPPSIPDSADWSFHTLEQSAGDFHHVVQIFKQYYKGKWISTGGSKGGQTAMMFRYFYPEDVDVTVPYVAPLNLQKEDDRVLSYIADSISTPEARLRMLNYQRALLERRDEIIPLMKEDIKDLTFKEGFDKSYEYAVLEVSFAWWQYQSGDHNEIPLPDAPAEELYKIFKGQIDWFSDQDVIDSRPFFTNAYREMGFYGYDTKPFKDVLKFIEGDFASNADMFAREEWQLVFDGTLNNKMNEWFKTKGNNFLYIYGEFDPWSATGFWPTKQTNALRMTLKEGNHGASIRKFKGEEREKILTTLEEWLDLKIDRKRIR